MEIKFIGTGSGKTSLKRYHSSFIISSGKYNLLVDTGDGISLALLHQKILFNSINGILLSHFHPDHYSGLPSLIVQMKMNERENPLDIFCDENQTEFLKELIYQSYLFADNLGFNLNYKSFVQKKFFEANEELSITALQNSHLDKNLRQDKSKRLSFSCSSFLFSIKGKSIFFTGDIGEQTDLFLFEGKKIDIMISEITHITVDELLEAFKRLNPTKLFITHLSDEDEHKVTELSYELPTEDRRKIVMAFDGLNVKI